MAKAQKAKTLPRKLVAAKDVLHDLKKLNSNWNFVRKDVEAALDQLYTENKEEWNMPETKRSDHVTTMTCRTMNACRITMIITIIIMIIIVIIMIIIMIIIIITMII